LDSKETKVVEVIENASEDVVLINCGVGVAFSAKCEWCIEN
jgi:hypothetical protein